jgi:hypothetical protein
MTSQLTKNTSVFDCPQGKTSMMRLGFFVSLVVGSIMAIGGVVAMFMSVPDAAVAMMTGTATMAGGGFAKAVQAKWEQGK